MIKISKPRPEDAKEMNEVIKQSWYATYVASNTGITRQDVDQMYAENELRQIEVFKKRAENPKKEDLTLVAKDEERVVGIIRLVIYDAHTRVRTFYVHPEYTGLGIGTKLWSEGFEYIPKDRPVIAWPAKNTQSINFYKKLGFTLTGDIEYGEPMPSGARLTILKMLFNF